MEPLKIGFSQADITPRGKIALIGQYDIRTTREIFTPLQAVAMVIQSGGSSVYWAACDLLYITDTLIDAVCRHLSTQLPDFERSQLMLSATHIHSGPFLKERTDTTLLSFASQEADVLRPEACCEQVAQGIVQAILGAIADAEPVLTARASSDLATGFCRRVVYADGTVNMYGKVKTENFSHMECRDGGDTRMIYVYRAGDHTLKGILADVPCTAQVHEHATYVHADFWHYTREYVKKALNVPVFGICACAGDLSPRDLFHLSKAGPAEQMEQLGNAIGECLVQGAAGAAEPDEPAFTHRYQELSLPRWNPTPGEYELANSLCKLFYAQYGFSAGEFAFGTTKVPLLLYSQAEVIVKRFRENQAQVTAPVHVLKIGKAVFLTSPFECFVAYGDRIKAALPELDIFDVQLTDDYLGYLPTVEAIWGGGYSAMLFNGSCPPAGGDALVEESIAMLKKL